VYLKQTPEESDAATLIGLICGSAPDLAARIEAATPGERRRMLAGLVTQDFEAGRTVSVGGWVLSRTEARCFALASVTRPAAP
jgi:hypothetical protein